MKEHKNDVANIFMKKKLPDRTEENKEYRKNQSFNTRNSSTAQLDTNETKTPDLHVKSTAQQ